MMRQAKTIRIVEDARYREHVGPDGHPERPQRLIAVERAVDAFADRIERVKPRLAEKGEILRVHQAAHLALIEDTAGHSLSQLDPDTYSCAKSLEVARLAVGGTIDLALAVASGAVDGGLAAVRPPGHHAESDRPMGFCLFNNVAIAARALQSQGVDKLAILDWDVHHGNGTQHFFEEDPSVLYVSTHQFPYYPGTGSAGEVGRGRGLGTTVNVPMPAGCGDAEYIGVMRRVIVPVMERFRPEMILVSCGFDAHRDDPLASMEVSGAGFAAMTAILQQLAREICNSKLVFVLEGGYSESGLIDSTTALLHCLTSQTAVKIEESPDAPVGSPLRGVIDLVVSAQAAHFPGIGAA